MKLKIRRHTSGVGALAWLPVPSMPLAGPPQALFKKAFGTIGLQSELFRVYIASNNRRMSFL
ncbi:hypothetical protein FJU30_17270 [Affinibrenneria salicis]|uniref:Uncharacterized protein n=1 Tax=Affinibrenneria salicis TaxID=2590031 RepID=A0A5J5FYM5_9GAMM|nr:hypothetical protein [Affinibrenneria salicis]KAA8998164.1 hypothetical protein FJU30_17270 [Affinibrenneria salicis]